MGQVYGPSTSPKLELRRMFGAVALAERIAELVRRTAYLAEVLQLDDLASRYPKPVIAIPLML